MIDQNSMRERKAQIMANKAVKEIIDAKPDINGKELKHLRKVALDNARSEVELASNKDNEKTDKEEHGIGNSYTVAVTAKISRIITIPAKDDNDAMQKALESTIDVIASTHSNIMLNDTTVSIL